MTSTKHRLPALCALSALQLALAQAYAAPLTISNTPLFLTTANKANVLMMYGNSNSMDSDPTGRAVGSAAPDSKSEIARRAIIGLIDGYTGYINMGLLAYKQYPAVPRQLADSQYDLSYDAKDYDPDYVGPRNGTTKKFRVEVPAGSGHFIYYNVNLPAYLGGGKGTDKFCYSTTACTSPDHDFVGQGGNCSVKEELPGGPWDEYTCWTAHTGGSNSTGYSGSKSTNTFEATDSDIGQEITDFGKRLAYQFVSGSWFNNRAPGPGYLHIPVAPLDSTQAARLKLKLATSQFSVNAPVDPAQPLQNSGLTPLAGTVTTARNYFNNALTAVDQGGSTSPPQVPNSCGKNFLVTLTDGLPSVTADGVARADVDANLTELTDSVRALRQSAAKAETYVVGFALPYGVSITQLDSIAAAGGSGTAYYADNPATLQSAFQRIFADIIAKTSAASSVALNSQSVAVGAHVFQARFSSGDWSGQLLKLAFRERTENGRTYSVLDQEVPVWDAGARVTLQARTHGTSRTIITRRPNGTGVPFRWPAGNTPTANEISADQMTALNTSATGAADGLGALRLEYLRGSDANEGAASVPKFRARPTSKLGDIVNSAPAYVGVPDLNTGLSGYSAFRTAQAARPKMVYVGANDGMLHGFDLETGNERLAYVPTSVFAGLSQLTSPAYAHRYFVDASPSSSDVQFANNAWRTMLVSGMGAGARGLFGLDVTAPETFTEAGAASIVKFEYTPANDSDVGHIFAPITVAKMNNGRWAAVFGNGYNSSGNGGNGEAFLFVVDVETGAQIAKIPARLAGGGNTAETRANGLSAPLLIDLDGNDTVDVAYAGDLLGNMWKFDLGSTGQGSWRMDYRLFAAPDPITGAPDAGEHPEGGFMVYFGTGKYLEPTDVAAPAATAGSKAMFGVRDTGSAALDSELVEQTFAPFVPVEGSTVVGNFRKATTGAVDYASKRGWKLTFPDNNERVVSAPQLRDGRVIFTSVVPSNAECSPGGTSWFNEIDWLYGGELASPQIDTDGNNKVDSADSLVASQQIDGVASPAAIQEFGEGEGNMLNGSKGVVELVRGAGNAKRARRLSWRQLKK